MRTLERQDRIAYGIEDIERLYNIEVDFDQTNKIIQEGKQQTIAYLELAINSWEKNMEREIKVSVIIPVYNVETYISKCISSVIEQNYKILRLYW